MNTFKIAGDSWKTKPTDRFILKWIKCHLSARVTPHLVKFQWLRPWKITFGSTIIGMLSGIFFALGWGFVAGMTAMVSQVLDGVDGQFARLTGTQSRPGALLDSVLDRYSDGALVIGLIIYSMQLPLNISLWLLFMVAFFALIGSSSVSYSSARAASLNLFIEKEPTLASKGTRTTLVALSGLLSLLWPAAPLIALLYLAIHPNLVVCRRLMTAYRA